MGTIASPELSTKWGLKPENIRVDLSFKHNANEEDFEEEQSIKTPVNSLPHLHPQQGSPQEGRQDQQEAPPPSLPPSLPSLSATLTELRLPHSNLTSLSPCLASLPLLTCLDPSHNLLDSSSLPRRPGRRPRPPHPPPPRQPAHRDTEVAGRPQQMHQVTDFFVTSPQANPGGHPLLAPASAAPWAGRRGIRPLLLLRLAACHYHIFQTPTREDGLGGLDGVLYQRD